MADVPLDPEALLGELTWLRALARRLCDQSVADDVCQATVLAALERRPDPGPSLRPWLTRVLRNLSLRMRRDDARRQRREDEVRRPEAGPATDEVVARAAAQRAVVEAVMELADPYRTTVLLRFFEDLPPRRVAERMSVAVDTVHTRLRRAMALLRERLDRGHGERKAWLAPLAAWCGTDAAAGTAGGVAVTAPLGVLLMTIKTKLLVATAALLAMAAAWFAFGSLGDNRGGGEPMPAAVGSLRQAQTHARESGDAAPATAERTEATVAAIEPGPQGLVDVRVVHLGTGEPAGGAEVWFGNQAAPGNLTAEELREWRELADPEAMRRRFFKRTIADADGCVRLPAVTTLLVTARAQGKYGELMVQAGSKPTGGWQLAIQPDVTVQVQTVDAEGRPLPDVPIALEYEPGHPQRALPQGRTSGVGAMLTLRHLQSQPRANRAGDWVVTTCIAGAHQARAAVERRALPREPIRLVVPATGRLVVQLVDPHGAPIPTDSNVVLTALDAPLPDGSTGRWEMRGDRAIGADGRMVFPFVGLGSRIQVSAHVAQQSLEDTVPGPKAPGEEVVVKLTLSDRVPVLCGRALDGHGKPIGSRLFVGELDGQGTVPFQSDAEGRFRWHLHAGMAGRKMTRVHLRAIGYERADDTPWALLEGVQIQGGEQQLGDLQFGPAPLVVAGQVFLGHDAAPCADLAIQVHYVAPNREPPGMRPPEHWDTCWAPPVQWTEDARFTIRAHLSEAERLRLCVKCGGMQPVLVDFTAGSANVRVQLQQAAGLRVRLPHHAAISPSMFVLRLDPAEGEATRAPRPPFEDVLKGPLTVARPIGGGLIEFAWLERKPGRYRLQLSAPAEDQPALQRDVTLVSGTEQTLDLQLPRELRLVTLRVVDAAGAPITGEGACVIGERSDGQQWFGAPVENGKATLLLAQPSCRVMALAPHFAPRRAVVTGDDTLTLLPAMPVRIRLASAPVLPPDVSLRLRLDPQLDPMWRTPYLLANGKGGGTLLAGLCQISADADGTFQAEVPLAGRYRLLAVLARGGSQGDERQLQLPAIDIAEADRSKEVALPEPAFARALQALQRR